MEKNAMQRLNEAIKATNSRVCAGLDLSYNAMPMIYQERIKGANGILYPFAEDVFYEYAEEYINAIRGVVPAIKINAAFFEQAGCEKIFKLVAHKAKEEGLFVIGDVKRADIGNTSAAYAEAYLGEDSPFDAITINPYFGTDGVMPFLEMAKKNGKGVFILVKTSNNSSEEIQDLILDDGRKVYEAVSDLLVNWGKKVDKENYGKDGRPKYPLVGAVVGATYPKDAYELKWRMGDVFTLVPGYGAQGATADDVAFNFDEEGFGAIVNSSRGIMNAYKSKFWKGAYPEERWAEAARAEAMRATDEINFAINRHYGRDIC